MRTIKMFALALFAIAAMVAMSASAASASTELVQTKGTSKAFTVKNTTPDDLTASTNVECTSGVTGNGTLNSSTDALVLLQFHKCAVLGGAFPCTSTGESSGLIHSLGLILFNRNNSKPLLLFEKDSTAPLATFSCAGTAVEVQGTVNGVVTNRKFGAKVHSFEFNFEVSGSEQLNMVGEEPSAPMLLEAKTGSGSVEKAEEDAQKVVVEFTEAGAEAEFKE